MYEIISVLRQSAIVHDFDVLELIDEDSVKLIKIKAVLEKNWLLYITELHTKDYQKYSYHCQKNDGESTDTLIELFASITGTHVKLRRRSCKQGPRPQAPC